MPDYNTETLSEHDLKVVANIMAKDPEFGKVLADAISEQLDNKYGWRQGELTDGFEKLEDQLKNMDTKLDHMQTGIDNLSHNMSGIIEAQQAEARNTKKSLLKAIENLLGVPR